MVGFAMEYKNLEKKRKKRSPEWLRLLLGMKFFEICDVHRDLRKSETNIYCVECNCCMCPHCSAAAAAAHRGHHLLQIRRYVYRDVIRIHDIQKFMDCSKVQPYTVNSAKVVLLNPRTTQSKPSKGSTSGPACDTCGQAIHEPNRFCSLACKVSEDDAEPDVSSDVDDEVGYKRSEPFISSLTSDLEAYSPTGEGSSTCLSSPLPSDSGEVNRDLLMNRASTQQPKKSRRKGVPRRAPFF